MLMLEKDAICERNLAKSSVCPSRYLLLCKNLVIFKLILLSASSAGRSLPQEAEHLLILLSPFCQLHQKFSEQLVLSDQQLLILVGWPQGVEVVDLALEITDEQHQRPALLLLDLLLPEKSIELIRGSCQRVRVTFVFLAQGGLLCPQLRCLLAQLQQDLWLLGHGF